MSFTGKDRSPKTKHPDGHEYGAILDRISKKRKNSNSYKRALALRNNYVNWFVNRCDWSDLSLLRLEDNRWLHYKSYKGRRLYHNSWGLLRQKVQSKLDELGVQVKLIESPYRSQRCSECGWVQKKNRKAKTFCCPNCGHYEDADINSAKNQLVDLPYISEYFRKQKLNREGFFWVEDGIFDPLGQELGVPVAQAS